MYLSIERVDRPVVGENGSGDWGRFMYEIGRRQEVQYLYHRATEAANSGDTDSAFEYIEQVLSMDPKNAMAWQVKGNCLDCAGKCDEALTCYEKSLNFDPDNSETMFIKALTLRKLGRNQEAQCCVEDAVKVEVGE
jgi:tetratricopeptide (TPR) repeat protein